MTSFHPLAFDTERCVGRRTCVRACPTQALRVRGGHAELIDDRCIDCGECIKVCDRQAIRPLTHPLGELERWDRTVAIPSVALYTQLASPPHVVLNALLECGFTDVCAVSPACEEAWLAIELHVAEHRDDWPLLASDCPTVVRLVQARYPDLIDRLLPLQPARELAARAARERVADETGLSPSRIGVIYITPCPSKMVSIIDHPGMRRSQLDAAVSIADLYPALLAATRRAHPSPEPADEPETATALRWAWVGGRANWIADENTLSVAGLANVIRTLDDVEEGRLGDYAFISPMACAEGCVSGPLTVENPYVARARAIRLTRVLPAEGTDRSVVAQRYAAGDYGLDASIEPHPVEPLDARMEGAIHKMTERDAIAASLPAIDCGACGAPTCAAFADDVVSGTASRSSCPFGREQRAEEVSVMNLSEVVSRLEGKLVSGQKRASEEVRGGYASDLLSDVIAHAHEGDVWVTLQRHANIVAVASVRELAAIVLVAGREPEPAALARAEEESVPIIVTPLSSFEVIGRLHEAGLRGRAI